MDAELRNRMADNLEAYFRDNNHALWAPQLAARERINQSMRLNTGDALPLSPEEIATYEAENRRIGRPELRKSLRKESDFLEIVSATGTGKTRLFGRVARGINMPTIIVTPRNILNRQTINEFINELHINPNEIGIYDGQQSPPQNWAALSRRYLITTDRSLPRLIAQEHVTPESRPLVILDELWAMQGQSIRNALQEGGFMDRSQVMAFMATDAGVHLTYGRGQAPIYNLRLRPAVERGYLVDRVRTAVVDVDINRDDPELLRLFAEWENQFRDREYPEHLIQRFTENPAIINGALNYHMGYRDEATGEVRAGHSDQNLGAIWRYPTVFYTFGVAAAERGAKMFNQRARDLGLRIDGHYARAEYISGEMTRNQQQEIIDRFKSGRIQALYNDRVIQMGFDDPNLTCVYSLKPSRQSTEPTQILGRATRRQEREARDGSYNYFDRFGVNKVALGINMRTQTMRPYTFFQVLEKNQPEIYNLDHGPSTGGTGGPDQPRWPDWMRVRTTAGAMHEVSALPIENRDTLLSVGEGWDGRVSIRDRVVVNGEQYSTAFDQFWEWLNSNANRPRGQEMSTISLREGEIQTQMRVDGLGRPVLTIHMEPPEEMVNAIRQHLNIPRDISPEVETKTSLRKKLQQRIGRGLNAFQSESYNMFWENLHSPANHPVGRECKTVNLGTGPTIQTELRVSGKTPEVTIVMGTMEKEIERVFNIIQDCCDIPRGASQGGGGRRGRHRPGDPPNHHESNVQAFMDEGTLAESFREKVKWGRQIDETKRNI